MGGSRRRGNDEQPSSPARRHQDDALNGLVRKPRQLQRSVLAGPQEIAAEAKRAFPAQPFWRPSLPGTKPSVEALEAADLGHQCFVSPSAALALCAAIAA